MVFSHDANQKSFPFILPKLPFQKDELEPHMSMETFDYHHEKHHNAYVVNLNKLLETKSELHLKNLEEIILISSKNTSMSGIFNNAAQVWNHTFFWHSMKKDGGGKPSEALLKEIDKSFGSYEKFLEEFKNAATSQFGSGWVWLVKEFDVLKIVKTSNAETPITNEQKPLVCCDVWEHAYYIDFRNRRPDFVASFLENLINWDFAEKNYNNLEE